MKPRPNPMPLPSELIMNDPMFQGHPPLEGKAARKFIEAMDNPDMSKMSKEEVHEAEHLYNAVMNNSKRKAIKRILMDNHIYFNLDSIVEQILRTVESS